MHWITLLAATLFLSACGGVIDNCPNGLRDPPWGSAIPAPHD